MRNLKLLIFLVLFGMVIVTPAFATSFFFSTGDPDGKIGTASRPGSVSGIEIESADDFVLTSETLINQATFTGLVPLTATGSNIQQVIVEIYRVFPSDSDVGRTSGPPTFSTPKVPTRVNSPSDVALDSRDNATNLSFTANFLQSSFTTLNSVQPGGINVATGGNGPITGQEVQFDITFTTPFDLLAGHYFFVPQVLLDDGNFLWLSAPRPIVFPGTPFPAGFTDLQSWIRDANLEPDWLRVGTDIVGPPPTGGPAPTFNAAFSLTGTAIPEPSTFFLMGVGLAGVGIMRRKLRK